MQARTEIEMMTYTGEYWVEAHRAVKDYNKIIGYGVWHFHIVTGRTCVHTFSAARKGGAETALYLANLMRDDLNKETDQ